jgi:hypothetical protein
MVVSKVPIDNPATPSSKLYRGLGESNMTGLPRGYDEWRTRGDWEDDDDAERKRQRAEYLMDQADYERDRKKDEDVRHYCEIPDKDD